VKEYATCYAPAQKLSFITAADFDLREVEKIRELLKAEILRRIETRK